MSIDTDVILVFGFQIVVKDKYTPPKWLQDEDEDMIDSRDFLLEMDGDNEQYQTDQGYRKEMIRIERWPRKWCDGWLNWIFYYSNNRRCGGGKIVRLFGIDIEWEGK